MYRVFYRWEAVAIAAGSTRSYVKLLVSEVQCLLLQFANLHATVQTVLLLFSLLIKFIKMHAE
jgi:hypothetical protein